MVWSQLNAVCERLAKENKHPRWLIKHLGGNDLASTHLQNLISMIQKNVKAYSNLFPETCIIWSDILPRAVYRGARSNAKVDKASVGCMPQINGEVIHHKNFQWDAHHLYRRDGVHLNDMGNDVMLGNIRQAMVRIISSQ